MAKDDPDSRKVRAQDIHRRIEAWKGSKGEPSVAPASAPETPAGFIHRRMRELAPKAKKPKPK